MNKKIRGYCIALFIQNFVMLMLFIYGYMKYVDSYLLYGMSLGTISTLQIIFLTILSYKKNRIVHI